MPLCGIAENWCTVGIKEKYFIIKVYPFQLSQFVKYIIIKLTSESWNLGNAEKEIVQYPRVQSERKSEMWKNQFKAMYNIDQISIWGIRDTYKIKVTKKENERKIKENKPRW